MTDKKVLIVGAGVAGLSAALDLARFDINVEIVEKSEFAGGHAIKFTCKAAEKCVSCGACLAEEKLKSAVENPGISILPSSRIEQIDKKERFLSTIVRKPLYIDPGKCTNCGECYDKCPLKGALIQGTSISHIPFYAISDDKCLYMKDRSCTACQDACPENAINLDQKEFLYTTEADAVILSTGFKPYDPVDKPYGYRVFENVITNMDLEIMLRKKSMAVKPSDNKEAKRIAFIQCVGSRDFKLNHLWCSRVCCGSALKMARLIKSRRKNTEITFFYMDVQTFGKDFERFYKEVLDDVKMIRSIPGDIFELDDKRLRVAFFQNSKEKADENPFDLVVLSIGIVPCKETQEMAKLLDVKLEDSGFVSSDSSISAVKEGVFAAGTLLFPMSIQESIASGTNAAWKALKYIQNRQV